MPSRRTSIAYGVATIVALGLAPALAAPDATPKDDSLVLAKLDSDHDGTVSLDEAKSAATLKFDALDTDKESTLDASELTGILGPDSIKRADTDNDKTLDKAEFLALVEKMFKAVDRDHDGTLDAKELSTEQGRALVALLAY